MFLVFAEDFRAQVLTNFCGFFQLANRFLRLRMGRKSSIINVVLSRKKAARGKILRQQLQCNYCLHADPQKVFSRIQKA